MTSASVGIVQALISCPARQLPAIVGALASGTLGSAPTVGQRLAGVVATLDAGGVALTTI